MRLCENQDQIEVLSQNLLVLLHTFLVEFMDRDANANLAVRTVRE